jgi:hypothetical protein
MSPTELIKCQMQTNNQKGAIDGPWEVLTKMIKKHGIRDGFFRGFTATLLRDIPSCGIYFGVYEGVKRYLNGDSTSTTTSLSTSLIAGGTAGVFLWGSIYPLDLVKSKIQSFPLETPASERGIITVFKKTYNEGGGYRVFTRGFGTTIARALPCNAVTLTIYEIVLSAMRNGETSEPDGVSHHPTSGSLHYPVHFY